MSNKESLYSLQSWVDRVNSMKESYTNVILVGSKMDVEDKEITKEEAIEFANKVGYPVMFTSSATGDNVNEVFVKCLEEQQVVAVEEQKSSYTFLYVLGAFVILFFATLYYMLFKI